MNIAFTAAAASGLILGVVALFDTAFWFNALFWWYGRNTTDLILNLDYVVNVLITFTIGASFAAFFMRTGGGIFTKAADMGADYVGKVESGLREDDYRNPATIADNVGDNVGDVAGMGADLYESYVGSMVATAALGAAAGLGMAGVTVPMIMAGVGVLCSIIGTFFVRSKEDATQGELLKALRKGVIIAAVLI